MPSNAASHTIFFIAAIVISTTLVGTFFAITIRFADSVDRDSQRLMDQMDTDFKIINDPAHMPYNATNSSLTLYLLNTGTVDISNSTVKAFVNGTSFFNITSWVEGGGDWDPDKVLVAVVHNITLNPGEDYFLRVVVAYAVSDDMEFST